MTNSSTVRPLRLLLLSPTGEFLPNLSAAGAAGLLPISTLDHAAGLAANALVLASENPDWLQEVVRQAVELLPRLPLVVVTSSESSGLCALRAGADDWIRAADWQELARRARACQARRSSHGIDPDEPERPLTGPAARQAAEPDPEKDRFPSGLGSGSVKGSEGPDDSVHLAAQLPLMVERGELLKELRDARDAGLRTVGLLLEWRDLETKGHTDRVVTIAGRMGEYLGLGPAERQALRTGAYLHDIGKIALPDQILFKPGPLTETEFDVVRKHAEIGFEMLLELPFVPQGARQIVRHHHERWDGRGYPARLSGDEIPLLARMFSMVDVYDALVSRRPYKPAWPRERALAALRKGAGRSFDPELTEAFLRLMEGEGGTWADTPPAVTTVTAPV